MSAATDYEAYVQSYSKRTDVPDIGVQLDSELRVLRRRIDMPRFAHKKEMYQGKLEKLEKIHKFRTSLEEAV